MHKRFSALDSNYLSGKYPFNNNTNIIFKECNNLNLNQIACWPNTLIEMESFFQNSGIVIQHLGGSRLARKLILRWLFLRNGKLRFRTM